MKNLAIVIAVSDYGSAKNNLPACKKDAALVTAILKETGKYDDPDILLIDTNTKSSQAKSTLADFIANHQHEPVEEVFFYYTGHGDTFKDDFLFLFSDYDPNKRLQTSLTNTELDTMLRSLRSQIAFKVVDACHSGVSYIKDKDALTKALDATKAGFKKCYFMFSSQRDEFSFQDKHISAFTDLFARAFAFHSQDSIRYQDIANVIADGFSSNQDQTPFFITQADLVEVYSKITPAMRAAIQRQVLDVPSGSPDSKHASGEATTHIVARVKSDAAKYCTKDEVGQAYKAVSTAVGGYQQPPDVSDLYTVNVLFFPDLQGPYLRSIARWLETYRGDYFVELKHEREPYEEVRTLPAIGTTWTFAETLTASTSPSKKYRTVVSGFDIPGNVPFKCIKIEKRARFPNILSWNGYIVPIFSKVSMLLFYCLRNLKEVAWDEWKEIGPSEWKWVEVEMKDQAEVARVVEGILESFDDQILKAISDKFKSPEEKAAEEKAAKEKDAEEKAAKEKDAESKGGPKGKSKPATK